MAGLERAVRAPACSATLAVDGCVAALVFFPLEQFLFFDKDISVGYTPLLYVIERLFLMEVEYCED